MDAETGPGAVATGGGDWKAVEGVADKKKRARSPDDEGEADADRMLCVLLLRTHKRPDA